MALVFTTNQLKKKITTLFLIYNRKQLKTKIGYYPFYLALEYGTDLSFCIDTYMIKMLNFRITCDNSYGFTSDIINCCNNIEEAAAKRHRECYLYYRYERRHLSDLAYFKDIKHKLEYGSKKEYEILEKNVQMRNTLYENVGKIYGVDGMVDSIFGAPVHIAVEAKKNIRKFYKLIDMKYVDDYLQSAINDALRRKRGNIDMAATFGKMEHKNCRHIRPHLKWKMFEITRDIDYAKVDYSFYNRNI